MEVVNLVLAQPTHGVSGSGVTELGRGNEDSADPTAGEVFGGRSARTSGGS